MNAKLSLSLLAVLAVLPLASAQNEAAKACGNCASKDQTIKELKAELQKLQKDQGSPQAATTPEPAAEPSPPAVSGETYTVLSGDSLMKIARKTGCNANELATANGLAMNAVLKLGQKLKLPAGATAAAATPTPAPSPTPAPKLKTYKIQDGDTYFSLSRRLKIPVDALMAANPQAKPNQLYAGRTINLPGTAEDAVAAPNEAPPAAATNTPTEASAGTKTEAPAGTKTDTPSSEKKIRAVMLDTEITYGEFAAKHGTDIERLNALNDLNLTSATILAKGSELYVPAQP